MSSRAIPSLVKDFEEVTDFLADLRAIKLPVSAEKTALMRKLHHHTYSLVLWKFRLRNIAPHGLPFIEEVASDALQILPQIVLGYGKTVRLLSRSVLENTVRHIYFCDHPVEFARMNRDRKWYLEFRELIDYLKSHTAIHDSGFFLSVADEARSLYSDLSTGVHGTKVADLEMRTALKAVTYIHSAAKREAEFVHRLAACCNILLAAYHGEQFARFSMEDRRIILRAMPRSARKSLAA